MAGVMVGPFTPGVVADQHLAAEFAEIGIALMLFGVGIHFSLRDLVSVWRIAVPGALLQVGVAAAASFVLARYGFGWGTTAAIVLGMSLAIASTAVATRVLDDDGLLSLPAGHIALGWLVMQDLIVILALVLLPAVPEIGAGDAIAFIAAFGKKLLEVAGFVAFVLVVGRLCIPRLLAWTARDGSRELFRLAVIVVALGVAYASAELAGVSLALGAFFAGVVLAESDVSHQAAAESVPIQQVFTVLFFVSSGMLFNPDILLKEPLKVAALIGAILAANGGATLLILMFARRPVQTAASVAAALAQIGEFSFILTSLAVAGGMLPTEGRDLVVAAAIITIILNPFLFRAAQTTSARLEALAGLRNWQRGAEKKAQRGTDPPHSDHVIIVGHGRVGSHVAGELRKQNVPYFVVEQDLRLAQEVRAQGMPAIYGDAGWPEVLGAAHPETARLLIIAIPERGNVRRIVQAARDANPNLPVIVRTHSDAEADWLRTQDIERVVMSERQTAIQIAEHALRSLNLTPP